MKAVQSKNMIAIMQPPLRVGVNPVELVRDEIVHNHYGTPAEKNKLYLNGIECPYCYIIIVCPVLAVILFLAATTLKFNRAAED